MAGNKGFDIVLVRKSGPVQTMNIGSWLFHLLVILLVLILSALGAASYFIYMQQETINNMAEDVNLIALKTERLEFLVQEQETRELLSQQEAMDREAEEAAKAQKKPEEKKEAAAEEAEKKAELAVAEPKVSDTVAIRNVSQQLRGGQLFVTFDVTNINERGGTAEGYVSVVLKGQRKDKPWIEAWPPMRLTPLGRPVNYRRGTPFAVQRFRRIKAKFSVGDKAMQKLEFIVYDREGNLLLVQDMDVTVGES